MPINKLFDDEDELGSLLSGSGPVSTPAQVAPQAPVAPQDELSQINSKYDTERQKLVADQESYDPRGRLAAALAAIGAGFQGGNSVSAATKMLDRDSASQKEKMSLLDKWKAQKIQEIQAKRDAAKYSREDALNKENDDPSSEVSRAKQQLAAKMLPGKNWSAISGSRLDELLAPMKDLYKIQQENVQRGLDRTQKEQNRNNNLENIPLEDREVVKSLSQTNANRIGIANAIDSAIASWPAMGESEKLQSMKQLIKTLNSDQGKDAVGAEEAKRLASKLQFAYGNFTNDNPTQFGRDLEGFAKDAENTSAVIKSSIAKNEEEIARRKGQPIKRIAQDAPEKTPQQLAMEEIERRKKARQTAGK